MSSIAEKNQYEVSLNSLGIRRDLDPFPLDPPQEVDYWADNKSILQKIIQAQIDSTLFASSFIHILYGPAGVGKTFAVKYMANPKMQQLILHNQKRPDFTTLSFRVAATAPLRTGQLTFSLYRSIVGRLFDEIPKDQELLSVFQKTRSIGSGKIKVAFQDMQKQVTRSLDGKLEVKSVERTEGYRMLIQERSRLGRIQDVNELVEVVKVLAEILHEKYDRIIISLDELENLRRATGTERILCSDFLRKLHETIDYNMTLFLIFTFEALEEVEQVLQTALLSRVKDSIEFPFVRNKADVKQYITECILMRSRVDPSNVIEQEVIAQIASSLVLVFKGRLTFRVVNIEMHRIFTSAFIFADRPDHLKITTDLYNKAMRSLRAKDVAKQITDWTSGQGEQS